jgi:formate--tetrahydrofolate ligase
MALLLKDAIKPNLVQTLEANPAIIHGGPFANIAQGTNSVIATKMALSLSDYVVTEAGFGADLGAEKFLNLKCQVASLRPKAIVLVATIRALRHHGGAKKTEYGIPNLSFVERGFPNLEKHIENCKKFGITPVVALNHFHTDSDAELNFVISKCKALGVEAIISKGWAEGGNGTMELAKAVVSNIEEGSNAYRPLYDWKSSLESKILTIAREIYGADDVEYSTKAKSQLREFVKLGFDQLPICMAKTQKSLSDDERKIGRPVNFNITIREFEVASGAGFVIPILGEMMRMPGLPVKPAAEEMDIANDGTITGLS